MKTCMLDTHILIHPIKQYPSSVARRVDAFADDDRLVMSFVTRAELLAGAQRSDRRARVWRHLQEPTPIVTVAYPRGPSICQHYAEQSTRLRLAGTLIGANDLWIACHAWAEDATLVTHNMRELGRIQGLRVEDWACVTPTRSSPAAWS